MQKSVHDYAREALAAAPIDDDEREFLETFLDPRWVIDALVAWALVHCRELILAERYLVAGSRFLKWADHTGVFHEALSGRIRHIFAGVVVLCARNVLLEDERNWLN